MTDDTSTALEERLRHTYAAIAQRTDCSLPDELSIEPSNHGTTRRPRNAAILGLAVACVVMLVVGVVALIASGSDSSNRVGTSPTTTPAPAKWPGRLGLPLPDGTGGFIPWRATIPPNTDGFTLEASEAAMGKFQRTLSPVTRKRNPHSIRIGYFLPTVGFVLKSTVESPGFDVNAVIAHGPCKPDGKTLMLVNGGYQCVTVPEHAKPLGIRIPQSSVPSTTIPSLPVPTSSDQSSPSTPATVDVPMS